MSNLVRVNVSKQKLILDNLSDREFEVTVTNLSDKFASFEIELETKFDVIPSLNGTNNGSSSDFNTKWYSVEPEICSKLQPGDNHCFRVVVNEAPVPAYDKTIELLIKVFSIEYEHLSNSSTILLDIKQPQEPLNIYLPYKEIKAYPGDDVDIPVVVSNSSSNFQEIDVILQVENEDWHNKSVVKGVSLTNGQSKEVILQLKLPNPIKTDITFSNFLVSVRYKSQDNDSASDKGAINILPYGEVVLEFPIIKQIITGGFSKLFKIFQKDNISSVEYQVKLENKSNLEQEVKFEFASNYHNNQTLARQPEIKQPIKLGYASNGSLNNKVEEKITVTHPQHLWGGMRKLFIKVSPIITNPKTGKVTKQIQAQPNTQILELIIYPIIPLWLIVASGLLGVFLLWFLYPRRSLHNAPIYSVRLIGNAGTVISGSSDTNIRRWQVSNCHWFKADCSLQNQGEITNIESNPTSEISRQPIRVIREIPEYEGQIAAGLEDGIIQIWQVSPPKSISSVNEKTNDRVFDLNFTRDSKYLFSGHGSGKLRQWDVNRLLVQPNDSINQQRPLQEVYFNAAISSLAVVKKIDNPRNQMTNSVNTIKPKTSINPQNSKKTFTLPVQQSNNLTDAYLVAVGGQYNKLGFWKSNTKFFYRVDYKYSDGKNQQKSIFGSNDYINTLSIPSNANLSQLKLLVTGDNKGFITLWDLTKIIGCIDKQSKSCHNPILNQWSHGDNFPSVYSVSMPEFNENSKDNNNNSCYIASAGSDGRVVLWGINRSKKAKQLQEYFQPGDDSRKARSVDIKRNVDINNRAGVVLISAAQGNQVSVYRYQEQPNDCK
ncbi:MAG: hypothetical protein KME64_12140 [Scytonematopsis contorta HA4267-MV1]|jgi:hypothetical protein|nr:hypothetical protein [Scytonematopsis contorta HA4267-MV1]